MDSYKVLVKGQEKMTESEWLERCSQITKTLWVGDVGTRTETEFMTKYGIERVVSILTPLQQKMADLILPVDSKFRHLTFNYDDDDEITAQDMKHIIFRISENNKCTLLHCVAGMNRSTCVALCYLIGEHRMSSIAAANQYWAQRSKCGDIPCMTLKMVSNANSYLQRYCANV